MSEALPTIGDPVAYQNINLEDIDRAIRDWFDKTVNAHVKTPQQELQKVPVIFSSGERWSTGRMRQVFRDENGVLILPIISVRRVSIEPDPSKMALGVQTDRIQIAKRVDPKTSQIRNLYPNRKYPAIYDVYTIPFPDRMQAMYQLVVQTQFISQMNDILQKTWRVLDIQKSFVAPFENDGRQPPRVNQYGSPYEAVKPLPGRYVVGFLDSTATDSGNIEEFTDAERIVKYSTEVRVPFVLLTAPEGEPSPVKVERTAYKLVLKESAIDTYHDPEVMDEIFGPLK